MGWSIGYDRNWERDIGYEVPAVCDHPGCDAEIDRGLSFVCGSEPYGGEYGCGLYFCEEHQTMIEASESLAGYVSVCERCEGGTAPFAPKSDVQKWINHKLNCPTWQQWRDENPDEAARLRAAKTD